MEDPPQRGSGAHYAARTISQSAQQSAEHGLVDARAVTRLGERSRPGGRISTAIILSSMALNIKDPDADKLARTLAQETGETITEAVNVAVKERLERLRAGRRPRSLADELDEIALRCAALPVLDERPEDDILGYDTEGLPS
jgi:antitoxin VapB